MGAINKKQLVKGQRSVRGKPGNATAQRRYGHPCGDAAGDGTHGDGLCSLLSPCAAGRGLQGGRSGGHWWGLCRDRYVVFTTPGLPKIFPLMK